MRKVGEEGLKNISNIFRTFDLISIRDFSKFLFFPVRGQRQLLLPAGPIPLIFRRSETVSFPRQFRLLFTIPSNSLPRSTADFSFVPELMRIASNSASLRVDVLSDKFFPGSVLNSPVGNFKRHAAENIYIKGRKVFLIWDGGEAKKGRPCSGTAFWIISI